ncbi:hypothetical protein QR680_012570 [Steinernema hermaphroditum]|uniref:Uncharacterized protein n=1 Tax=Steinernema hermaphroditum TaxID=289476 RepID=A0AA39I4Q8_9BILA|nr:hypothetical protein QR680_012570 [Steinernema hermaphroditum]
MQRSVSFRNSATDEQLKKKRKKKSGGGCCGCSKKKKAAKSPPIPPPDATIAPRPSMGMGMRRRPVIKAAPKVRKPLVVSPASTSESKNLRRSLRIEKTQDSDEGSPKELSVKKAPELIPETTQAASSLKEKKTDGLQRDRCRVPREFEEFAAREYFWDDLRVREWSWGYSKKGGDWKTLLGEGVMPTLCYRGAPAATGRGS